MKAMQVKIENWDSAYPLADIEEKVKSLEASFEVSVASCSNLQTQKAIITEISKSPSNKNINKQLRFLIKKKNTKLSKKIVSS